MAGAWLFFAAWLFGVALAKAPTYARLYENVGLHDLPAVTVAVLSACAFVARFWYLFLALLLIPLALILRGTFDGKTGPFTVVTILGLFVVATFTSLYLFIPLAKVKERMKRDRPERLESTSPRG